LDPLGGSGRNDSKRNFNYRMQMLVGANRKPKASKLGWKSMEKKLK
jgi:hypothetical protein